MREKDARAGDIIEIRGGDRYLVVDDAFQVYLGNADGSLTDQGRFGTRPSVSEGATCKIVGRAEFFDGSATVTRRGRTVVARSTGDVDLRNVLAGKPAPSVEDRLREENLALRDAVETLAHRVAVAAGKKPDALQRGMPIWMHFLPLRVRDCWKRGTAR